MIRSSMRRYHTYQELYAKGALCGPVGTHKAPKGALCGSTPQYLEETTDSEGATDHMPCHMPTPKEESGPQR